MSFKCSECSSVHESKRGLYIHKAQAHSDPFEERFWDKVCIKTEEECWEWQGYINSAGYGHTNKGDKTIYAHRAMVGIIKGKEIEDKVVMDTCDNPPCVNPNHLRVGSYADNTKDCVDKGRDNSPRGVDHGHAKLNPDKVKRIRELVKTDMTYKEISKKFDISLSTITEIKQEKIWTHV